MPIRLIDNLRINTNLPVDTRMIASSSTERDAIDFKYDGMKVFQLDTRATYIWNLSTYTASGITSSSWDIGDGSGGNINGQGIINYVTKWNSTGNGLTNSSIISTPINFNEKNQKIGIGGTANEAFQVSSNYDQSAVGVTLSAPFVIHKGANTTIGENWYYDIGSLQDRNFQSNQGSSVIVFNDGNIQLKGRQSGGPDTLNSYLSVTPNGSSFSSFISIIGTSSTPTNTSNSLYFNSTNNRWKVMEAGQSRNISQTYENYTVILTQTGTSAPVQTILDSTIGSGVWSYVGVGIYRLTISGGFSFTAPQISGFCGPYTSANVFFGSQIDFNTYEIRTLSSAGGSLLDGLLQNTFIDIKIWKNITLIPTTTTTTTTTLSPGASTTTTSTTTTTTTAASYLVSIYSKLTSGAGTFYVWYSVNNASFSSGLTVSGINLTTSSQFIGNLNIPNGATLSLAISNSTGPFTAGSLNTNSGLGSYPFTTPTDCSASNQYNIISSQVIYVQGNPSNGLAC